MLDALSLKPLFGGYLFWAQTGKSMWLQYCGMPAYRNTGFPFGPVIIGTVCHIEGLLMGRLESACMLCRHWWSKSLNKVCHFWHPQRPSQGNWILHLSFVKLSEVKAWMRYNPWPMLPPFLYIVLVLCVIKNMMLAWFCTLTQVSRAGKYPEIAALVVHCFSCPMVDIAQSSMVDIVQSSKSDFSWLIVCCETVKRS
jgi:hypothetical protein